MNEKLVFKAKLWPEEHCICFQILEQNFGENKFYELFGEVFKTELNVGIEISNAPGLSVNGSRFVNTSDEYVKIFIRGVMSQYDFNIDSLCFNSNDVRDKTFDRMQLTLRIFIHRLNKYNEEHCYKDQKKEQSNIFATD